jgi:hypothetical protein
LLNRLASFRSGALALFDPARILLERALDLSQQSGGPDHPRTASIVNNLGLLHRDYGDLAVARPLLEPALAIRLSALGVGRLERGGG